MEERVFSLAILAVLFSIADLNPLDDESEMSENSGSSSRVSMTHPIMKMTMGPGTPPSASSSSLAEGGPGTPPSSSTSLAEGGPGTPPSSSTSLAEGGPRTPPPPSSSLAEGGPGTSPPSSSSLAEILGGAFSFVIVLLIVVFCIILVSRGKILTKRGKFVTNNALPSNSAEYADIGPEISRKNNVQSEGGGYCYADSGADHQACPYEVPESTVISKAIREQDEAVYMTPSFNEESLYAQLESFTHEDLCRDDIKLGEAIGSGQFGEVYKGSCKASSLGSEVAVKTLKKGASQEDRVKFLQEAAIMGQFSHSNVVIMYGVVTESEPILLVLELLINGDLRNYLLRSKSKERNFQSDGHTLLSFCRQISCGMTYLSKKGFVHRDLAARNILVSDDEICKIGDFGMSRDLTYESYYISQGGMIPVKWTAPEALHYKKYSTASDVWSYGVVMYEIWSLGHKPFENIDNNEVMGVIDKGLRLAPPPGCPRSIYSLMMDCWHLDAVMRPAFSDVSRQLSLPDSKLLQWQDGDKNSHVRELGANLEFAFELHKDVQQRHSKLSD